MFILIHTLFSHTVTKKQRKQHTFGFFKINYILVLVDTHSKIDNKQLELTTNNCMIYC